MVCSYLYKFIRYRNNTGYWYPIHITPLTSSWVVVDEDPSIMHRVHNDRPLLVWIIGTLLEIRLSPPRIGGLPVLYASIDFVREEDRSRTVAIHNAAASVSDAGSGPVRSFDLFSSGPGPGPRPDRLNFPGPRLDCCSARTGPGLQSKTGPGPVQDRNQS